ncbi:MAG: FtsQ-type POTRA domain-containing protein [Candidatus Omnitrophica bacterium]|nr:FtsQ-type POTRA domain-containing protein [Candidatus Omnitrophota bacterium]
MILLIYPLKLFFASNLFIIKDIKTNVVLEPDIIKLIKGKSLFSIDLKEIYSKINSKHPEYKKIQILKQFPSTLSIDVTKRIPFAQIVGKYYYMIDKEAVVISDRNLKPSAGFIPIKVGEERLLLRRGLKIIDKRLQIALLLIDELNRLNRFFEKFPINFIDATSLSELYFAIGNTRVIIGGSDFDKKLRLFKRIVEEELNNDLSLVEYIDLRYENIYIRKQE